jgi:hypothetical protein
MPSVRGRPSRSLRDQFGNDPAVCGNGDSLARLDATDVAAEIVLQLADAR